ncbi:MAG TPA: hypothetical protein DET40_11315 [Lentisphaeria bacterium]|nr:MAG: hypothetical protein A2X45_19875 [Lentisphaerae bacterium GWF2_50_93]HCE44128.1 hypothetical protein [Lentisphaeria bacterium]
MKKIFIIFISVLFVPLRAFPQSQTWHPGLFRINTSISAGDENIERVSSKADQIGMEFIVFSDQFLVRGEYGLPPFRNILKKSIDRQSICTYGVDEYLKRIEDANKQFPRLVLVPGADIAPHYYWTGSPFRNNLTTRQFSEQLTVFGIKDADFYKKLPVIHNSYMSFSFFNFILSCLPLIISVLGVFVLISVRKPYYADAQGNKYFKHKTLRISSGIILVLTGLLWCIDNRPLSYKSGFNQYSDYGQAPYQKVIDYVRKTGGDSAGITWSAPEAKMRDRIFGINLLSVPYLDDIERTNGHNGLAGVYGDAFHAHEAGKTWDKLLLEYCSGKRSVRPVIFGESDYHGHGDIAFIQTVVNCPKITLENVVYSLLEGRSYAISLIGKNRIVLDSATVENGICVSGPGEVLKYSPRSPIVLNVKGRVEPENKGEKHPGEIRIILDGKEIERKMINLGNFTLIEQIPASALDNRISKHYVRFYIRSPSAGFLLSNPIFIEM